MEQVLGPQRDQGTTSWRGLDQLRAAATQFQPGLPEPFPRGLCVARRASGLTPRDFLGLDFGDVAARVEMSNHCGRRMARPAQIRSFAFSRGVASMMALSVGAVPCAEITAK
eukprot:4917905-Pyramimonas_sp.AAC.1